MKIVQINTFPTKATGNVMMSIHKILMEAGHESYVVWGRGRDSKNPQEIVIKDELGIRVHGIYTRLTDRTGFASRKATKILLKKFEKIKPDIIHLHNIHGYYINIEMLFHYIREHKIQVVWTFHDCWSVTGHCAYFDMVECEKWKTGCYRCQQKNTYPSAKFLDSSSYNWNKKKELFSIEQLTIVTPCKWLKEIVVQSYLSSFSVRVFYNGVDINVFKPIYREDIHKKYSPDGKPIVLGVASEWTERKGLDDFVKLSEITKDKYQIVIVGLSKSQIRRMPHRIHALKRTEDVQELVELYSAADVYFNPTYEDNFPSTNMEALACGTPVVTYDTGGSPESIEIGENQTGHIIGKVIHKLSSHKIDIYKVEAEIEKLAEKVIKTKDQNSEEAVLSGYNIRIACRQSAIFFCLQDRMEDYIRLYQELLR